MDFLMMLRKLSQSADFTLQSFADRFFFILLKCFGWLIGFELFFSTEQILAGKWCKHFPVFFTY
ncbi:hypothetical protein DBR27_12980 [Flavobacterium sp. HMWF030]|nr:hypothetical protein DBR27_12980 [Flavobacterium sp. HMWF030]